MFNITCVSLQSPFRYIIIIAMKMLLLDYPKTFLTQLLPLQNKKSAHICSVSIVPTMAIHFYSGVICHPPLLPLLLHMDTVRNRLKRGGLVQWPSG